MRNLNNFWSIIVVLISFIMLVFHVITNTLILTSSMSYLSIHLTFVLVLLFILVPATKKGIEQDKPTFIDILFALLSIVFGIYVIYGYMKLDYVASSGSTLDIVMTIIAVSLIIEAARRMIGPAFTILVLIFMAYPFIGGLPGAFAHRGFTLSRMVTIYYFGPDGIYGVALRVSAFYIYFFLLFGAFLTKTGIGQYFIDMALSLTGRFKGGAAYASVLSSGFTGMITGSAAANVVTTGTFTIPLMKYTGFKDYQAAATEAYASAGGYITPPIMGASAFIIALWLGIPYWDVVVAAIAPALLYYLGAGYSIYIFSNLNPDIKVMKKENIPRLKDVLSKSIFLLASPISLIVLLFLRFTITDSVLTALVVAIITSYIRKDTRISSLKGFLDVSKEASIMALKITPVCAAAGIVIASVGMTGLGIRISRIALSLASYNVFLGVFLVGITCLVFGMGLPAVGAYVLVAILGAPALVQMGIPKLVAHFTVLWYASLSNITPPVAIGAYVAAGVANCNVYKTAWAACKMAIPAYILPFFFVLYPKIILGSLYEKLIGIILSSLIIFVVLSGIHGYFLVKLRNWQRFLCFVITVILFFIYAIILK